MDPISCASKRFLEEAEAFWRNDRGSVLPMIAERSDRGELVKTLRLHELEPRNRRPVFLYEEPFNEPESHFNGLAEAIQRDYELIREGAGEEGVVLPPFALNGALQCDGLRPLERAVCAVERAAALISTRLDGVLVALVPSQVTDGRGWQQSIDAVRRVRFSASTRLGVYDPPGGPLAGVLGDGGAHLRIDQEELFAYLRQLGDGASIGPPVVETPERTEGQRLAPEAAGSRGPSPGAAARLRALLLDGAQQENVGQHAAAAELYQRAQTLCAADGLALKEAMVLMALGGACLGAGAATRAIGSYLKAAGLGQAEEAWEVVCQAWLGVGGAHLTKKNYWPAARAYRAAAEAAEHGEVAVLRIEALRMAGTCLLLEGSEEGALLAWKQAVDVGAELTEPARRASTLRETAMTLTELLRRRGLNQQAAHVQSLIRGCRCEAVAESRG